MREEVVRTGPLQSGLAQLEWLSYRTGGRGLLPNLSWPVGVPGTLSTKDVIDAVNDLLARHEALRTTYDEDDDGSPRQRVHDHRITELPLVGDDERSRLEFVDAPFDVEAAPPIRFGRHANGDLVFAIAHIAIDGLGAWVFFNDLVELLAARAEHRAPGLDPVVPQPIDQAQHERADGRAKVESALRHWTSALRDFPATVVPVSRGRPGADVARAYLESPAASAALARLHTTLSATPSSILTAAAYTALAIQFSRQRLGMNLTWSFREYPATREVVAAVFRDMPLVVDLSGRPSFTDVMRRLRRAVLLAGRQMAFDVLEFHECAGRAEAGRGSFLPGPEVVNCTFDGVELEPARPGVDPRDLLSRSRLTLERTNHFADVCNLYVSAYPVDARLLIEARVDSAVPGADDVAGLVRLIEAILVQACARGDLTFDEAEALATDPWRPGPRWSAIDDVWVDLDFLAHRLREHPGVRHADVREEDGRVTAHVDADLEPWELRDFLLSTDNGRNAVVSPPLFAVSRADGSVVTGSGVDRPEVEPVDAAGHALRDAVAKANGLTGPTMAGTYLTNGGRLHLVPRVLALLLDCGFEGLEVADFRRPASLLVLAGRLRQRS